MSKFISIAPNLYISDNPLFGNYNCPVVYDLLRSVDVNFSESLGLLSFSSCRCLIDYIDPNPMCCSMGDEDSHLIFLHVTGDYWCRWIYQFAHEYCHHLINGPMVRDIRGLMWFEETLCEVSSMYHLHCAGVQWPSRSQDSMRRFAPFHQKYLDDLLKYDFAPNCREYLQSVAGQLAQPVYHREIYSNIATAILPLFVAHPPLWKIILHLGDMRRWDSLEELFDHLRKTAVPDDQSALLDLGKTLLG